MSNVALNDILPTAKADKVEIIPPKEAAELDAKAKELQVQTKKLIEAHKAVLNAVSKGCAHAMDAGEALIEIKGLVGHGKWLDYVEDQCGISDRQARRYMELARQKTLIEQGLTAKWTSVSDLSQSEAKRLIGSMRGGKNGEEPKTRPTTLKALKAVWDKAPEDVRRQFKMVTGLAPKAA
jgi:hypothetical protein